MYASNDDLITESFVSICLCRCSVSLFQYISDILSFNCMIAPFCSCDIQKVSNHFSKRVHQIILQNVYIKSFCKTCTSNHYFSFSPFLSASTKYFIKHTKYLVDYFHEITFFFKLFNIILMSTFYSVPTLYDLRSTMFDMKSC